MSDESIQQLKDKLNRTQRTKAVLAERSKLLAQQVDDLRRRDEQSSHLMGELIERQRELNFMLHRANSVFQRMQETNLALSTEFTELVRELPAPESPEWEQRVSKINDLFKKTGEMVDEVESDVFLKGSHSSGVPSTILQDEPTHDIVQEAKFEPAVEIAEATEPEPEPIVQEIIDVTDATIIETSEEINESREDLTVVAEVQSDVVQDAEIVEDDEKQKREERLNRLFSSLPEDETQSSPVDEDQQLSKSGTFTRIWRKITGRDGMQSSEITNNDAEPHLSDSQRSEEQGIGIRAYGSESRQALPDLWDESSDFETAQILPEQDDKKDDSGGSWNQMKSAS